VTLELVIESALSNEQEETFFYVKDYFKKTREIADSPGNASAKS